MYSLCAKGLTLKNDEIMNKTIFFEPTLRNISGRDVTECIFPFRIVDSELIGKTDEMSQSSHHTIKVVVSRTVASHNK